VRSHPALFNSLINFVPDALLFVDQHGFIVQANTQAERLFGYPLDQLQALTVDALLPERLRHRHSIHRHNYSTDPKTREMGASVVELLAVRCVMVANFQWRFAWPRWT
jgi:PAS domain S-box-containing protein